MGLPNSVSTLKLMQLLLKGNEFGDINNSILIILSSGSVTERGRKD